MNLPLEGTLTETIGDVTYHARWYVDYQAVVLYIGTRGPMTKMLTTCAPDVVARQMLQEFSVKELARHLRDRLGE
jgi:hypothetical protein